MYSVYPINTLHVNDNYAWAIIPQQGRNAYVVDPGESEAVLDWLQQHELQLSGILITHRHWDHVNGVDGLLRARHVPVWGPESVPLPAHTQRVGEGDAIQIDGLTFDIMALPGHTPEHIAYVGAGDRAPALFCGDTLFASGCGRVLGGTAGQLYRSLQRLAQLPPETQIFCAHEYTLANLAFALAVEPDNTAIIRRRALALQQRERGEPTLPSHMALELQTNPFLRCDKPAVIQAAEQHAGNPMKDAEAVFTALRRWKDEF